MPRVCTVCGHPKRAEIEKALIGGADSLRNIAERSGLSVGALNRHKADHITSRIANAKAARDESEAIDVMTELKRVFVWSNKLASACDAWLSDADNPTVYNLGPRSEELMVTFTEEIEDPNGKPMTVKKKKPLSTLLEEVRGVKQREYILVETKYADPRELILKAAARLGSQTELLAKLVGELDERATINVLVAPEWTRVRSTLFSALEPFPDARVALSTALSGLEMPHVA